MFSIKYFEFRSDIDVVLTGVSFDKVRICALVCTRKLADGGIAKLSPSYDSSCSMRLDVAACSRPGKCLYHINMLFVCSWTL